jgi:hypothetical protein
MKKGKSVSENQKWTKINVQNRFSQNNLGKTSVSYIINCQNNLKNKYFFLSPFEIIYISILKEH